MTPKAALTLAIVLSASAAEAGALVAFRPKASVAEGVVTLGDVADVRGSTAAEGQKLSAIILGPGPDGGRETTITYETVRSRLMAAGVNLAEVEFSGASSVTVHGASQAAQAPAARKIPLTSAVARTRADQAVAAAIRRYLESKGGAGSFAIEPSITEVDVAALAAASAQGFDISGGAAPWIGQQVFMLRFLDTSERVCEVRVGCLVKERPSVLATRHGLPKGHVLRTEDLVWAQVEAADGGGFSSDPQELIGRETQRTLRSGEPVPPDAVRSVPLVRNGQFVTVTSRRPGVAVQRVMKAKGDGSAGETIPVYTLEDRKTVLVRVTGVQEAEVVDQPALGGPPTGVAGEAIKDAALSPAGFEQPASDLPRVRVNPSEPLSVPGV